MTRAEMLHRVQAADFAALDAALFLDTHPDDTKALACFYKLRAEAMELRNAYESVFGPLTVDSARNKNHWDWINEPWPWERGE